MTYAKDLIPHTDNDVVILTADITLSVPSFNERQIGGWTFKHGGDDPTPCDRDGEPFYGYPECVVWDKKTGNAAYPSKPVHGGNFWPCREFKTADEWKKLILAELSEKQAFEDRAERKRQVAVSDWIGNTLRRKG